MLNNFWSAEKILFILILEYIFLEKKVISAKYWKSFAPMHPCPTVCNIPLRPWH